MTFQKYLLLGLLMTTQVSSSDVPINSLENTREGYDFSWQTLMTLGFKIALAYFTSPGGLDKSDEFPTQAILGTIISAITDIKDPQEIATMAKQANEVLGLAESFLRALQTSVS